jgi:hypothetical protein
MEGNKMNLNATYGRIGEYIMSHESETYSQIASTLGLSRSQVSRIARLQGLKRGPGKRAAALEAALKAIEAASHNPHCASAGEVAPAPVEEPISIEPDAPLAAEALSTTPDIPSAEAAVL